MFMNINFCNKLNILLLENLNLFKTKLEIRKDIKNEIIKLSKPISNFNPLKNL